MPVVDPKLFFKPCSAALSLQNKRTLTLTQYLQLEISTASSFNIALTPPPGAAATSKGVMQVLEKLH